MGTLAKDLGQALRKMRRAPGFTAVVVITLALGIGANTAIFSVVDAVMLKPLPLRDPGQLVEIKNGPGFPLTGPNYLDMQRQNHAFQAMALYTFNLDANLTGGGQPDYVSTVQVEPNFFQVLGATALRGRTFSPGQNAVKPGQSTVLSYALWQKQFAGDQDIVGQDIELNGEKVAVIGVMPPALRFPAGAQLWVPMDMSAKALGYRGSHQFLSIGRLKAGVTPAAGLADLKVIARRLAQEYPEDKGVDIWLQPLRQWVTHGAGQSLTLMLWAVGLVLLIACVNVANLLLARASARHKEMAVRAALGAGRWRLLRQLLTESILLALIGGALGVGLAEIGVRLMASLPGAAVPQATPIQISLLVLAFTFGVAVVAGILFGLAPAWQLSRATSGDALKGGAGAVVSAGKRRRWLSDSLVVAEVAFSMLLLVAAGLLLRSFWQMQNIDIGARRTDVLTAWVKLPSASYGTQTKALDLGRAWLGRVRALPGVETAAITDHLPMGGGDNGTITLYGRTQATTDNLASSKQWVEVHGITPGYFATFGIPLIRGRKLTEEDVSRSLQLDDTLNPILNQLTALPAAGSAVAKEMAAADYPVDINQTMAKMFWPNQDPLGKRFSYSGAMGPWLQVEGVVADTRQWSITVAPRPEEFQAWDGGGDLCLVTHTSLPPAEMVGPIRGALRGLDASLPMFHVRTMQQVIAQQTGRESFVGLLVAIFAGLALLLAAVGVYGVMSYLASQRMREMGIRVALGAPRGAVLALMTGHGMRLAGIGIVAGGLGALAASQLLKAFLYDVHGNDPATFVSTAVVLAIIALLACLIPARRAARVDPAVALRDQ
ncbi:MAG: ABC transporter permease [Terriglobales bacterium]